MTSNNEPVSWENLEFKDIFDVFSVPTDQTTWATQSISSNIQTLLSNEDGHLFWSNLQLSHLHNVRGPEYTYQRPNYYNSKFLNDGDRSIPEWNDIVSHDATGGNRRFLAVNNVSDWGYIESGELSFEYLSVRDIGLPYLVTNVSMLSNNNALTDSNYGKYLNMKERLEIELNYTLDETILTKDPYPDHFFKNFEDYNVRANYLSNADFDDDLIMMSAPLTYLMIRSNMLEYSNEVTANYINDNREFDYRGTISSRESLHDFVGNIIGNESIVHANDIAAFHLSMLRSNLDSMSPFEDFWNEISSEETDKPASAVPGSLYNSNWIMYPSVYFAGVMASNITSNEVFKPYIRNDLKTYTGLSNLDTDYLGQEHTFVNLQTLSNVLFNNPIIVDVDTTADHLINKGLLDGFLTNNAGGHVLLNTTQISGVATAGPSLEDLIHFSLSGPTSATTSKIEDVTNKKKLVNYETLSNYFYGHLLMPDGSTRIDHGWSNFDETNSEIRRRVPRMDTILEYLDHNNYLSNYNHRVVEPVVNTVSPAGGGNIYQYNIHDTMSMTEENRLISTHSFSNYLFDTRPTPGIVSSANQLYTEMYDDDGNTINLTEAPTYDGVGTSLLHTGDSTKFKIGHGLLGFVVNSMDIINNTVFHPGVNPWEHNSLKPYTMVKHRVPSMREMSNYVANHIDYAFIEKTGGGLTDYSTWDGQANPTYLANITNTVAYFNSKTWDDEEHINRSFTPHHINNNYLNYRDLNLDSNVTLQGLRNFIRIGYYGVYEGYIQLYTGRAQTHQYPTNRVTQLMTGPDHPHTSLLTVSGLSNYLYESGLDDNKPFVLDDLGANDFDIASLNGEAHSYRAISARVFSNITSNLESSISQVETDISERFAPLIRNFADSNNDNYGAHSYQTLIGGSLNMENNKFVTDLSLRKYLRGQNSFLHTEIIDKLDSNVLNQVAYRDFSSYFNNDNITFVTPVGLSNIVSEFLIDNSDSAIDLSTYGGHNAYGEFKIPSMKRLSNYIDYKTQIKIDTFNSAILQDDGKLPTVFQTSNIITKMIDESVSTKLEKFSSLQEVITKFTSAPNDTDNQFGSIYLMSNLIHDALPKISYDYESVLNNKDFRRTEDSSLLKHYGTSDAYTYDEVVPTVTYTSNMINTIMLAYLEENFKLQQYDGVIDDNALLTNSMFSRTRDIFDSNDGRLSESYIGSNTGNQTRDTSDLNNRSLLSDFTMDGLDSDMFATDFSSMSTAEALAQDSEQTYASILSTKLLYEVMKNSDKLMHMGSIYRMMNDFYEIKRISTTNFNDLVTSRFYSDRILINSSDVNSDRSFITVGWNNDQPLAYSEEPIFEIGKDKSTMINGDLLLGKNKWMLSFDEDTLSIKKYDRATDTYVEKHVFT